MVQVNLEIVLRFVAQCLHEPLEARQSGFIALVDARVRQHLRAHQRNFLPQDGFRFRRRLDKSVPRDNFHQPVVVLSLIHI